jgi:hypothetical protein
MVGLHESTLRGVSFQRGTSPYTLWMLQRSLDAYRELPPGDRARVDAALADTGWAELLTLEPRYRLGKKAAELVFES